MPNGLTLDALAPAAPLQSCSLLGILAATPGLASSSEVAGCLYTLAGGGGD